MLVGKLWWMPEETADNLNRPVGRVAINADRALEEEKGEKRTCEEKGRGRASEQQGERSGGRRGEEMRGEDCNRRSDYVQLSLVQARIIV